MATAPISYGNDYATEQSGIERARQYAALMQQQSMETPQTQVVGGWAIPNGKMSGVAKLAQALGGAVGNYAADKRQKDLADKQKLDLTNTLTDAQKAYMGTPAVAGRTEAPLTPNDDEGNANSPVQFPGQAAVAGDPMKYANILMQNPQTQQMGMQAAQQAMQQHRWAQALGLNSGGTQTAATSDAQGGAGGAPAASNGAGSVLAASGITSQEAQASLLADPTGKQLSEKILAARAESQKPVVNRGYGIGTMVNGKYVADPASTQQALGMETSKADIAAGHKVVGVPQPDGTTRYMTEAQQIQQTGGGKPPMGAPMPPQGGMPGYIGQQPNGRFQGDPQAIMQQIQAIRDPNERAAAMQAMQNQASGQNPNPQAVMRAGTPAMQGQPPPQGAPMQPTAPQQPPTSVQAAPQGSMPGFSAGQSTSDKSMAEHQGKTLADQEAEINHNAESAIQKIAQNNQMVNLIPSITTGPFAKQATTLKMLGNQLGINIGDPSSNQEFEKYAIKGALEGAKQIYGARLTNQDVMSQIQSNPGTSMADKALYQLIKYDNVQQQRNIDKRQAYFNEYKGPKNQFGMWFDQNHPFMGIAAPAAGQAAAQSAPAQGAPASAPKVIDFNSLPH